MDAAAKAYIDAQKQRYSSELSILYHPADANSTSALFVMPQPALINAADIAAMKASYRAENRSNSRRAEFQPGGIIKLVASPEVTALLVRHHLFSHAPLLNSEWLQGRMSESEWCELILGLNDAIIDSGLGSPKWIFFSTQSDEKEFNKQTQQRRDAAAAAFVAQQQISWRQRGVNLQYDVATPESQSTLLVVPITGLAAPLAAAGISAPAVPPPAYHEAAPSAAASSSEGGTLLSPGGPSDPSFGTFADVVKPTAQPSTAGKDDAVSSLVAKFRFCPLCGASVPPAHAAHSFCAQCGGAWR